MPLHLSLLHPLLVTEACVPVLDGASQSCGMLPLWSEAVENAESMDHLDDQYFYNHFYGTCYFCGLTFDLTLTSSCPSGQLKLGGGRSKGSHIFFSFSRNLPLKQGGQGVLVVISKLFFRNQEFS